MPLQLIRAHILLVGLLLLFPLCNILEGFLSGLIVFALRVLFELCTWFSVLGRVMNILYLAYCRKAGLVMIYSCVLILLLFMNSSCDLV